MSVNKVSFVHTSDTHLGPTPDFSLYKKNPLACCRTLVKSIQELGSPVDFVVHTGDLVNRPEPAAFELATEAFSDLACPVIFVNGNHDDAASVLRMSEPAGLMRRGDFGSSYEFVVKGYRFLVIDCKGPAQIDPHGEFTEDQFAVLTSFLECSGCAPMAIFVHFPPVPLDVPWVDRDMLMLGGERFHQTVSRHRDAVLGVFFGHIHQSLAMRKDGVFYYSAPSPFCRFSMLPGDQEVKYQPDVPVACNYVTFEGRDVIVKEHLATESYRIG